MNDIRQGDMAEQLGVSRATLINYEKGHTTINVDVLERLKLAYPTFDIEFFDLWIPLLHRINNSGISY